MTIAHLIAGRDADIISCTITTKVSEAVALLAQKRIGALPVMDGAAVAGIFSERDVVAQLGAHGTELFDATVDKAMTAPAITVSPETHVLEALALMTRRRVRHLPVVDGGAMVGFISIGDLVKYRIDRIEAESSALRDYIQTA